MLIFSALQDAYRGVTLRAVVNVVASATVVAVGIATTPGVLLGLSIAAAVGASCEALVPLHGGRRSFRSYATDITHAIGDRCLVVPLVALLLTIIGPLVTSAVPLDVRLSFARVPSALQVLLVLITSDLTNYFAHRWRHRVRFLWAFHSIHHSSERLDWLSTSRTHPVDLAIDIVAVALPTYALGQVALAPWLLTFFFLWPFLNHSNAQIRLPFVDRILVTPRFHHWHHAAAADAHDRNFGGFLSIWDSLFGTAIERHEFPNRYGIDGSALEGADYISHMLSPFRPG